VKGVHWIPSGQWPPAIALIDSRRSWRAFAKKYCGNNANDCASFPPKHGGCCQKLEDGAACIFVILVGEHDDQIELASTIAHEATHLMRWLFEHIGEDEPGTEAQAYLVEHIVRLGLQALSGKR
jgi:hypothetical protein